MICKQNVKRVVEVVLLKLLIWSKGMHITLGEAQIDRGYCLKGLPPKLLVLRSTKMTIIADRNTKTRCVG